MAKLVVFAMAMVTLLSGAMGLRVKENQAELHKTDLWKSQTVAVMFVGRALNWEKSEASFLQSANKDSNANEKTLFFSQFTGTEDGIPKESAGFHSEEEQKDDIWGNMEANLIAPLEKDYNVDLIVCVDKFEGEPPRGVQVYAFGAKNQQSRFNGCLQRTNAKSNYKWIVKSRPDFFHYRPIPQLSTLDDKYIYTRFRLAEGIQQLTSDHFSYNYCDECWHQENKHEKKNTHATKKGYVNDDMLMVMPASVVSLLTGTTNSQQALHVPASWINIPGWAEGKLTKELFNRGVMTMPLAAPGYPRHDRFSHQASSKPCSVKPVAKHCGADDMKMSDLHKTLLA